MTFRRYLILIAVFLFSTGGDFLLKMGMNQMGRIELAHPLGLLRALENPWIILGVLVLIGFFSSYLYALSWADLSYIMPATAFGYVITGVLAVAFLHERVSPSRWAGIVMITLAVAFATSGPSKTQREKTHQPALPVSESAQ